ncbi:MAG: cytochrome c [Silvanigrellales bacterium]|nr:cytochrome c [Silvanigrellales bacterium]
MDFPLFHMDFFNNRILIAGVAILHVLINHALAVGGIPLVVWLERKGIVTGDERWDALARKIMFTFFVVTTTVGAMSGVGIWFAASLVNPAAIGSLLRVFFWAWFVEWFIFVTEVILILIYMLTWKSWTGEKKKAHFRFGVFLSVASWITMALIVSILAFMMDSGSWLTDRSLFSGMLNPLYLPQLAFRTPLALAMGGAAALCLVPFFCKADQEFRAKAARACAIWTLLWLIPCIAGSVWYHSRIPASMVGNMAVALTTQAFTDWYSLLNWVLIGAVATVLALCFFTVLVPRRIPSAANFVPLLALCALLGLFERVREFIRKPYAIANYLYSNGYRSEDTSLLQRDGVLVHSAFARVRKVTKENTLEAGREVFLLTCTRCHTTTGVNGIVDVVERMYGTKATRAAWDAQALSNYIASMHNARSFMPPFPGSEAERDALSAYIISLRNSPRTLEGAQSAGVGPLAPKEFP